MGKRRDAHAGFKLTPLATALMLMVSSQTGHAGPGMGVNANGDLSPTFYAHSPSGPRFDTRDPAFLASLAGGTPTGAIIDTGKALRKFVDPLPGLCPIGATYPQVRKNAAGMVENKCIPVAVADKTSYPDADYYEIGVVEYEEWMHSDLAKPTRLRGYVQLNDPANPVTRDPVTGAITGWPTPHYLGPMIVTERGRAVRVKFVNLLPTGHAVTTVDGTGKLTVARDASGKPMRNGDLFIPVDQTLMGAGLGPNLTTMYLQNRAELHLHGGDTPWISDGTPHQWITPAQDQTTLTNAGMGDFARGAIALNVPDMPDPGAGAVTYYWPNNQSARLMFYHDHSAGITRLNVYAGEAAGYLITDPEERELVTKGALPADMIPLVIQEKTFVPKDIALQDTKWDTAAWGEEGDLWFPHVYETNQDPSSVDGTNPTGRWDWGPWFWPVFPSLYALPSGDYGDVSTTPEAFLDTPLVNGQAYPYVNVEPKAYRFRILNATNDRFLNLSLFVADDNACDAADPTRCKVEPKMVQFNVGSAPFPTTGGIMDTGWGQPDSRMGGVPDPATMGPNILQIGTEGGFLPQMVDIPPTPVNFEYARRSITVLNILEHSLLMGAAERADVVIDFSKYAGKTLILYNDAPAPVPASDPRIDFYHDSLNGETFDNYLAGGASPTKAGYGPNTRTVMQIRVAPAVSTPPAYATTTETVNGTTYTVFNKAVLKAELPKAYGKGQEKPIVPQAAYNEAFGTNWPDQYARIATGTLQQPTFDFTPADGSAALGGINVVNSGAGYTKPPVATITDGAPGSTASGAMAKATLKIGKVVVTNPGRGYVNTPTVRINTVPPAGSVTSAPGTGATGVAFLKVVSLTATGLTNLTANAQFNVDAPAGWAKYGVDRPDLGIAKAQLIVARDFVTNKIVSVTLDPANPGAGYTVLPRVTIADGTNPNASKAKVTLVAGVERVDLTSPVPTNPALAGGRGYTDMNLVSVGFTGGGTTGAPANPATARASGAVAEVTLASAGTGYTTPLVTLTRDPKDAGVTGVPFVDATAAVSQTAKMAIHNKAIQELFEPNYGRMNATLGVELPFTSALTQTTIPLAYIDPMTETLKNGETQIWKITHNGVDSHPVHFHLANVQLVNRIGWDGTVKPPKGNEFGWKETVMMNPLEDVVVAIRAKRPTTNGFGLPESYRLMDPTQPQYAMTGFTQIDAATGTPAIVYNDYQNYNWEYVWHCHILGHEENDFMRPIAFDPMDAVPVAPDLFADSARASNVTNTVVVAPKANPILYWNDNATTEYRYDVYYQLRTKKADGTWPAWPAARTLVGTALANAKEFVIPAGHTAGKPIATNRQLRLIVSAVGAKGVGESSVVIAPLAP